MTDIRTLTDYMALTTAYASVAATAYALCTLNIAPLAICAVAGLILTRGEI